VTDGRRSSTASSVAVMGVLALARADVGDQLSNEASQNKMFDGSFLH
jgi:hypothetical protein